MLVVPGVEGDVAAIARHGGAHARVDDLLNLLHDADGIAFIDDIGLVGFVRGRRGVAEHRTAGGEVIHDGGKHMRLQVRPLDRFGLGDGDEIAAEIDALDAIDVKESRCQRRGQARVGISVLAAALPQHVAAREKLQRARIRRGFGLNKHGRQVGLAGKAVKPVTMAQATRRLRFRQKQRRPSAAQWRGSRLATTRPARPRRAPGAARARRFFQAG